MFTIKQAYEAGACDEDMDLMCRHLGVLSRDDEHAFTYEDVIAAGVSGAGRVFYFTTLGGGSPEQREKIMYALANLDPTVKGIPLPMVAAYAFRHMNDADLKRAVKSAL